MGRKGLFLFGMALLGSTSSSQAQQVTNQIYQAPVEVQILPIAELEFIGPTLLHLEIPPAGSTWPSAGVKFRVTGNASASVSASPDEFIEIPATDQFMGKAVRLSDAQAIGYGLLLEFPKTGPGYQAAGLPGTDGDGTTSLTVALNGGQRQGAIQLSADPSWNPDGSAIPLPGLYVGEIVLTLTADF